MPQLDLSFFKENILFTLFSFGLFYFFLYNFIIKKLFTIFKKKIEIKKEQNNESIRVLTLAKQKEILDYKLQKQNEFEVYKNELLVKFEKTLSSKKDEFNDEISSNFDKLFNIIKKRL